MAGKTVATIDGNEAVASVAYRINEVIAIYPITPSSPMSEFADEWSASGKTNIWGSVPSVVEMQSEGGAVAAVHGALQTGSLSTTFTASQGLLLMIPNMYKIAGELTPCVFHVAARSLATQALCIFCDHSDVMAVRQTGFALISSASVQEAMDCALISQAASLKSRIPFLHFFDGFRTSHEVAKVDLISDDVLRAMIDEELVLAHRARALSPDHPVIRGTAHNPDVYFQARETVNPFYAKCPEVTQEAMDQFAKLTGRQYKLYEYHGAPDAERVIVMMGSGCEAAHETVDWMNERKEKVGLLKVRLYRPFDSKRFVESLPATVKKIAVLDRTKEPGAVGEPLHVDCISAIVEAQDSGWGKLKERPMVLGGRYGIGSKEFTPAMVKGVFDHMSSKAPKHHFTVGINDDVFESSISYDANFSIESQDVIRALFYGLGADGTVGANKNSIKIIGEQTPNYAQGHFVYDSKKSGSMTVSHLRFGPRLIRSSYQIANANFIGCHNPVFLERYDVLYPLAKGGTVLLNTSYSADEVFAHLPRSVQMHLLEKRPKLYVIDAYKVAGETGMGRRINTIMQVCFFAISGVLPKDEAIEVIKYSIKKTYGKKGEDVVQANLRAVDQTLEHLFEVRIPDGKQAGHDIPALIPENAPDFVKNTTRLMLEGKGDELPVSALPSDGTYPTATAKWEKRNIALQIPVWDPSICIQCGKCAFVCPHAVIRIKVYDPKHLGGAPATFKSTDARDKEWKGMKLTIQVAPEDCTGCTLCVDVCPARNKSETRLKAINMQPQPPLREPESKNWDFFLKLPNMDRRNINVSMLRQQQVQEPLFEFSGACEGCGETPYVKLISQLFGDRMVVANATGCSSIYGGNLPTTPWTVNSKGKGPAWANSLFEDNAEFGLGFRISIDKQKVFAEELLKKLASSGAVSSELTQSIISAVQKSESDIYEQRNKVDELKKVLKGMGSGNALYKDAKHLLSLVDVFVKKSVWIVGGDGWAYDIGFGGLDHVFASGRDVNILVLDTEVYSNTGGQMSKSTPRGSVAKFAANGKQSGKKDLGLIAMTYGNVYVASVAMGARDEHTLRALLEAEAYDGPSLVIAYSHCIAHGINMATGLQNQKSAVDSGHWLLYRFHPERARKGEPPLVLDSPSPKIPLEQRMYAENRFKMLTKVKPEEAKRLLAEAERDVWMKWKLYDYLTKAPWVQAETPKSEADSQESIQAANAD